MHSGPPTTPVFGVPTYTAPGSVPSTSMDGLPTNPMARANGGENSDEYWNTLIDGESSIKSLAPNMYSFQAFWEPLEVA